MIEVEHLRKTYGHVEAVRDISFTVEAGAVVGFLGPNGAGKSTTLRILAGFLGATSGRVRIGGHDIADARLEAARNIGYMPETSPLYPELRVREYLGFRAELKRVPRARRKAEIERVLAEAFVADVADQLVGHLSKGYRQRVGLADALLGSPPLLILDEPTAGLDPNQIREVRELIRRLAAHHTILLSTHILPEVEATCDRALVIHRGRLVAEGDIDTLRAGRAVGEVALTVGAGADEAAALLGDVEGVEAVARDGLELRVTVAAGSDVGALSERLVFALAAAKIGLRKLTPVATSLEAVFSELTEQPAAQEDGG